MSAERNEGLLRHSFLLMAATQVANVSNLLFQMVMGRALSPAQYGILSSMLGVVLVVATPMEAVRTAFAHFAARLASEGRAGDVRVLVWSWVRGLTGFGVPLAVLGLVFSGPISHFFRLESRVPVIITSIMIGGCPYLPIFAGALQGIQSFGWMAVSQHGWAVVRLLTGTALVMWIGRTAEWGLVGQTLGVCASLAMGLWGLHRALGSAPASGERTRGVKTYFFWSLMILGGFAVLMNADIIMVKHYFEPTQAGLFARAGTIGRSIIFLPMPIALAMFPKVASHGTVSEHNWKTLLKAVLLAGVLIVGAVAAFSLLAKWALLLLFNDRAPTADMIRLVRYVMWAMSPLSMVFLLMNFELARHRFRQAVLLLPCAVVYVLGVARWHDTVLEVAGVLAVVNLSAVVLLAAGLPWRKSERGDIAQPTPTT